MLIDSYVQEYPHGGWYLEGSGDFPDFIVADDGSGTTGEFCQPTTLAETEWGVKDLIIFCDLAFTETIEAPAGSIQEGGHLSEYESLSKTWIHELAHIWSPYGNRRGEWLAQTFPITQFV